MGLHSDYLPLATAYDPAEDPPGSVDPLGTLTPAERIAEVLFPGFTARMWRPRLLTFCAMASLVAERVVESIDMERDSWLEARLAFERLFVSAMVRQQESNPREWAPAAGRLPGSLLAQRALQSGDEPLGRRNFLKGQAVNGPFGVMVRLAGQLNIVDEEGRLARGGEELLLAWCADEGVPEILDEQGGRTARRVWLDRFVKATASHIKERRWMGRNWVGWADLAERLRPDRIGRRERKVLLRLIEQDPVRARCFELMRDSDVVQLFRIARERGFRGEQDRTVLLKGILPRLNPDQHEDDRAIELAIRLAEAYEAVAIFLETAFDGLLWALTRHSGRAYPRQIEADRDLAPLLRDICRRLPRAVTRLRRIIEKIPALPAVHDQNPTEPLNELSADAGAGAESPARLLDAIMQRHQRVQKAKNKAMWVEPGERWLLTPGFGWAADEPPMLTSAFLHPFRVPNAYSFLAELRCVRMSFQ